ncbi:response regulator [Gallaecimonas sp. GXIMD4217]|uniref:response regulator n=1 Tax=Gallaecimonas sp. GXIMD4217 TaxID=3131927 RepID=UPI00311B2A86
MVDDEVVFLELVSSFLTRRGFLVETAATGAEALACLAREHFDLLLCDLRLPDMDGLAVIGQIRDRHLDLPIIVISGQGEMEDVTKALRLGVADYLVKPLPELAVLEHALEAATQKRRLLLENQRLSEELEAAHVELELNLRLLEDGRLAGREVQQQLLPENSLQWHEVTICYQLLGASEVANQFVDFVALDDRYLVFMVSRFSAAGATSAFLSVLLKSLLNQPVKQYRPGEPSVLLNPGPFLNYLNGELLKSQLEQPVRLCFGVIDRQQQKLLLANAGYRPEPVLLQGKENHKLAGAEVPVGMFEWSRYHSRELPFAGDARLVVASRPLAGLAELKATPTLCEQLALPVEGGRDEELLLLALFRQ